MVGLHWSLLFVAVCVTTVSGLDLGEDTTEVLLSPMTEDGSMVTAETPASATTMVNSNKACDGDVGNKTQYSPDQLHEQVAALTNQLSKALAVLTIAQKRERVLTLTEKEKYNYVNTASDRALGLIDNVQHAENLMAACTQRERRIRQRLSQTYVTLSQSTVRLQVIRRLLVGTQVGLTHMESNRQLCESDSAKKKAQQ